MVVHMKQCLVLTIIKMMDMHGHEILVVPFDLVRPLAFLSYMSKIFLYYNRNRVIKASIFTPPALSTGIWKEPPQFSIRDLLQC